MPLPGGGRAALGLSGAELGFPGTLWSSAHCLAQLSFSSVTAPGGKRMTAPVGHTALRALGAVGQLSAPPGEKGEGSSPGWESA